MRSCVFLASFAGIIAFITLIILLPSANALKIISYSVSSDVLSASSVHQKLVLEVQNDGPGALGTLSLSLPSDSAIISAGDTYGSIGYSSDVGNVSSVVLEFSRPLEANASRLVVLELETDSLVRNRGDYFEYLLVFTPRQDISGFEHFLRLPRGAKLFSPKDFAVVFPLAELKESAGSPEIFWRQDLVAGRPEVFLARFRTGDTTEWPLVFAASSVLFAAIFLWFYGRGFLRKYSANRRLKASFRSLNLLNEREKAVVELVMKSEGIKQNDIRAALGYTKSSTSKIITNLEMRRIVARKNHGKINRIYPGEKLK